MKIHKIQLNSSINIGKINLAIGNFDGLHLGHKKVIQRLIQQSNKNNFDSAIMSFSPHPRLFFSRKNDNFNIISDTLKIKLLKQLGIKHFIILNFNQSIASLNPEDFIEIILVKKLQIKDLIVGNNFKFGKDRKGNITLLKEQSLIYNFTVSVLEQVKLKQTSENFSSTLIRKNIREGNVEKVNLCLGRNWSMEGVVIPGDNRAAEMKFPTANMIPPNIIHPKKGVYVVKILYEGNIFNGIANFGIRPTVDGEKLLLEAHLFDFNSDLYGKDLTVEFLAFIRDEQKFESLDKLKKQIEQRTKKNTAVIISDTFGRPFRLGQANIAIGIAGMEPIIDYKGKPDTFGKILQVTAIAVADELCSASELVMGKVKNCPVAIVRNFKFDFSDAKIQKIIRPKTEDLFR